MSLPSVAAALNAHLLEYVQLACEREAVSVRRHLRRGLRGLATISSSVVFLGVLETVLWIASSFRSTGGSRSMMVGITATGMWQSLTFTGASLAVALLAFWSYRYLDCQAELFDVEMQAAATDLVNRLVVHLRRSGYVGRLSFTPVSKRAMRGPMWRADVEDAPSFAPERIYRNGILELIWPHLQSDLDVESVFQRGMWVCFAYGAIGWLGYWSQQRPNTALLIAGFFFLAGWDLRTGSTRATWGIFAFLGIVCAACTAAFGSTLPVVLLALAPLLLTGSVKAARSKRFSPFRGICLLALGLSSCVAALFGTALMFYTVPETDKGILPVLNSGDRVLGVSAPLMGDVHRGQVISFHENWITESRVVGLPGDSIQVKSGKLIRNGSVVAERYRVRLYSGADGDFPLASDGNSFVVPPATYFLLNDDRQVLSDSRVIGPVPTDYVAGLPLFAYNPRQEFARRIR